LGGGGEEEEKSKESEFPSPDRKGRKAW